VTRVSAEEFRVWSQYVQNICGVTLDGTKMYLVEHRLSPLLAETGSSTFSELYFKAKAEVGTKLRRRIIDAITTRETSFFRDTSPFDLLRHKIIPEIVDIKTRLGRRPLPIRIWSAACSSGQEIYSVAIVLKELLGDLTGYNIQLVGTDISDDAVAKASYGVYAALEIERGLGSDKTARYFQPYNGGFKLRDDLRSLATFRSMNLLEPFPPMQKFDIIFCRNVAIYFNEPDKRKLFDRLGSMLEPHGSLIVGSTESLTGLCPQFEAKRHLRSVYYQLVSRPAGAAGRP
jgi:chemotaxis protein methyltransferase CheR